MSRDALERTALKEWAVLVEAMGRGDIIALIRKGGIREQRAGFSVRHDRFLLYPTYFHQRERELAPRFLATLSASHSARPPHGTVRFAYVAEPAAVWRVAALEPLRAIAGEHGLAWDAVESRFRYRDRPGVQVVAVNVSRLARPVEVVEAQRYGGCVSWVELDAAVDVSDSRPIMSHDELARRVATIAGALGAPESVPPESATAM